MCYSYIVPLKKNNFVPFLEHTVQFCILESLFMLFHLSKMLSLPFFSTFFTVFLVDQPQKFLLTSSLYFPVMLLLVIY